MNINEEMKCDKDNTQIDDKFNALMNFSLDKEFNSINLKLVNFKHKQNKQLN
jgi:hypothetical protein